MPNHLADETSPYLLQHADNPVDWYPWGEEALQKARAEDKPIFLSIGYSACHWCHVMAHESFEDADTAALMNARFVNIKVDREERPDLDRIYMAAVQALTGRGGWPTSVFLTPEGVPFYGGTYFPPTPRYGMPSFRDVLLAVGDAWQNRRQELLDGGRHLVAAIERQMAIQAPDNEETGRPETLDAAYRRIRHDFDPLNGGWPFDHAQGRGGAPKFPQPMTLEFLLRRHYRTGSPAALQMVTQTLDAMARGGMYDQLGGGFHRYSVDAHWTTPHFEKMLYDNAQLARVYLHAWQVTGNPFYHAIAEETLDYIAREMTDPAGGFYAAQDADSEGEEGKFFLWTPREIRTVLEGEADRLMAAYGVTEEGNFEGRNILELKSDLDERQALAEARRALFRARASRAHPARDDKVLTSWNGLTVSAFAEAARALGRDDYQQIATRNATFLLTEMRTGEGRLYHAWKNGIPKVNGYLEDYTHLIEGLIALYQATFDPRWYRAARELADTMIQHFGNPEGGFYDTADDHETLIVRPMELQDNAVPSGNGMAVLVLQQLAGLAADPRYAELAQRNLCALQPLLAQHPLAFAQWLIALDYWLAHPRQIAIVGAPGTAETRALLEACAAGYHPHQVVALGSGGAGDPGVPLLHGRDRAGNALAYICVDATCRPPVDDPAELQEALRQLRTGT